MLRITIPVLFILNTILFLTGLGLFAFTDAFTELALLSLGLSGQSVAEFGGISILVGVALMIASYGITRAYFAEGVEYYLKNFKKKSAHSDRKD